MKYIAFLWYLIEKGTWFLITIHSMKMKNLKSALYQIFQKLVAYFTGWDTLFSTGDERQLIQLW